MRFPLTAVRVKFVGDGLLALGWLFLVLEGLMGFVSGLPGVPLPFHSSTRHSMLRLTVAVLHSCGLLRGAIVFGVRGSLVTTLPWFVIALDRAVCDVQLCRPFWRPRSRALTPLDGRWSGLRCDAD
jgi:hypothetical protein